MAVTFRFFKQLFNRRSNFDTIFTHLDDIPFTHDILKLDFNHLGPIYLSTIWYDKEELR